MKESFNYEKLDEALEFINNMEGDEILNEVVLFGDRNFGLGMNPDPHHQSGYALDPYVKIFNNPNYRKATKSIDVSVVKGIAFHHPMDRKGELKFKEGGWKDFLDVAIRQIIDPPTYSVIFNPDKFYSLSDLSRGESYLKNKRPYRVYEMIFDVTMNYCMEYKQQTLDLYNSHPEPLEYARVLVYKK